MMFKKVLRVIGLPLIALVGVMTVVSPTPAKAGIRFGVAIGAPVYGYRAYPYRYAYARPYYAYPGYGAGYGYGYVAPAYAYPYAPAVTFGFGRGYYGGHRDYDRGYGDRGYYNRGYENRGYNGYRR